MVKKREAEVKKKSGCQQKKNSWKRPDKEVNATHVVGRVGKAEQDLLLGAQKIWIEQLSANITIFPCSTRHWNPESTTNPLKNTTMKC